MTVETNVPAPTSPPETLDSYTLQCLRLEFREQRIIEELYDRLSFSGLIVGSSSFFYRTDSKISPLASLYPFEARLHLENAAEYYGGKGPTKPALARRVAVLRRIEERINPLFITVGNLIGKGVIDEVARQKFTPQQVENIWDGQTSEWWGIVRDKIPDLEDRVLHVYGLAQCFSFMPGNIWKITRFTSAHQREQAIRREMLELFSATRGKIPAATGERLKKAGVLEGPYKEFLFRWDTHRLFSEAIAEGSWEKARDIANVAASGYDGLAEGAKHSDSEFRQIEFAGQGMLWHWIANNITGVLRSDIEYIRGSTP